MQKNTSAITKAQSQKAPTLSRGVIIIYYLHIGWQFGASSGEAL